MVYLGQPTAVYSPVHILDYIPELPFWHQRPNVNLVVICDDVAKYLGVVPLVNFGFALLPFLKPSIYCLDALSLPYPTLLPPKEILSKAVIDDICQKGKNNNTL